MEESSLHGGWLPPEKDGQRLLMTTAWASQKNTFPTFCCSSNKLWSFQIKGSGIRYYLRVEGVEENSWQSLIYHKYQGEQHQTHTSEMRVVWENRE